MFLLHNPTFKGAEIVEQAQAEIASIQKDGVDLKELDRARTYLRAADDRPPAEFSRARHACWASTSASTAIPTSSTPNWLHILAVTPEQIQAAAKKYCVPESRFVLEIQPAPQDGEAATMKKARLPLIALAAAMTLSAQQIDRTKPPQTGALPPFKLPPTFESTLPNGLRVVLVEDRRFPLVTVRLAFEAGSKFDPKDLPGLSEAVATLLTEGTKTRTSRQIAEQLAEIGGFLKAASGSDGLTAQGNALAENLPEAARPAGRCHPERVVSRG